MKRLVIIFICLSLIFVSCTSSKIEKGKAYFESEEYDKALKCFEGPARHNNPEAQYYMYECWSEMDDEPFTQETALEWLKKAADGGNVEAMLLIPYAFNYYDPDDDSYDLKKTLFWYKKAASKNSSEGCYNLGEIYSGNSPYSDLSEFDEAISWYEKGYECGGEYAAECCHRLAQIYGDKMSNVAKVEYWLNKGIGLGDAECMEDLGNCYCYGSHAHGYSNAHFTIDYEKANELLRDAHEMDLHCYSLAEIYYYGLGVKINYDEAARIYAETILSDGYCNDWNYSAIRDMFTPEGKERIATDYQSLACMMRYHEYPSEGESMFRKAKRMYISSIEAGYKDGYQKIAEMYHEGSATDADYDEAALWYAYQKAASSYYDVNGDDDMDIKVYLIGRVSPPYKKIINHNSSEIKEDAYELIQNGKYAAAAQKLKDYLEAVHGKSPKSYYNLSLCYLNCKDTLLSFTWAMKGFKEKHKQARELYYYHKVTHGLSFSYSDHFTKYEPEENTPFTNTLIGIYEYWHSSKKSSYKYLSQAASAGDPLALFLIAGIYSIGNDAVEKDLKKAQYWYDKANELNMKLSLSSPEDSYDNIPVSDFDSFAEWFQGLNEKEMQNIPHKSFSFDFGNNSSQSYNQFYSSFEAMPYSDTYPVQYGNTIENNDNSRWEDYYKTAYSRLEQSAISAYNSLVEIQRNNNTGSTSHDRYGAFTSSMVSEFNQQQQQLRNLRFEASQKGVNIIPSYIESATINFY